MPMVEYTLDTLPELTDERRKELARLDALPADQIDTSDIPQLTDEQWAGAVRGRFYRPIKQQVTARLDADVLAGLKAGGQGITVANKATSIYATYLEPKEKNKLELFMQVAAQAQAQFEAEPDNASAWYAHAYALGRYSQGISVAKALAQGLGSKVKESLEKTVKLSPQHAEARIALGAFHAEVIDKVGSLIGGMTYGAKKDTSLKLFQEALKLNPGSAIAMIEYANAMVMLEGDKRMKDATKLYEQAAACTPADAMERLDVELAKAELQD